MLTYGILMRWDNAGNDGLKKKSHPLQDGLN